MLPTLENFDKALFRSEFPRFVFNSFYVAVAVTVIAGVIGALAAYPIARMQFRGQSITARAIVLAYLLPPSLAVHSAVPRSSSGWG